MGVDFIVRENANFQLSQAITAYADLHVSLCTILRVSEENYGGEVFARGERRWYIRAETQIILKHYNALSDMTVDNRLQVDIAVFNRSDSHSNILEFGTRFTEHSV